MRIISIALVASLAAATSAQAKKYLGQDYTSSEVRIAAVAGNPFDHDGEKLWVKLQVDNATEKTILVDRNLIVARTPDGRSFKRIVPVVGKGEAFVLPPGGSERIDMEFAVPKNVLPVRLAMANGCFGLDTKPIPLPDYTIGEPKKPEKEPPPPAPPPPPPPKPRVAIGTELRPRWSLFGIGVAGFVVAYLPAAIGGPIGGDPEGLVPVIGPLIMIRSAAGRTDPYSGRTTPFQGGLAALFVVDGLMQAGGVALTVVGAILRHNVTIYAKRSVADSSFASLTIAPTPGGGMLRVTF